MTWTEIQRHQPDILERLRREFPYLAGVPLRRAGRDWVALVTSFAAAHDLTATEASEVLLDWLSRRASVKVALAA